MHYDLIIVGGGLVGAGLAVALRATNLKIALVDARVPDCNDPRLFALNASSCQFLENLNLWSAFSEYASPIHQVHVSHQGHFAAVRLRREEMNLPALGHVIPAHHIEKALNEALTCLPNCSLYRPAILKSLHQENHQAQLIIATEAGEKTLQSSIVIGADGTESTVRKELNIATERFDYGQTAIVTRSKLKRSHHHIAYERFHDKGAIAMLPLINDECATIWSADNAMISQLMTLSDTEFLSTLQQEFGYRLGRIESIQKRHVFPLQMVRAEKMVEQCVFLLGNSAHTLHPIAAQGFNLALYEVAVLVDGIMNKIKNQEIFAAKDLQAISARIQKPQAMSIGISHRLSRLFAGDYLAKSFIAQIGMMGLDLASPLKKRFMQGMLGKNGGVPRLLMD